MEELRRARGQVLSLAGYTKKANRLAVEMSAVLAQPHPGTALLEEQRRALVRARNEGLEKAAAYVGSVGSIVRSVASASIRAMKEAES
jgi:hypothetical protein